MEQNMELNRPLTLADLPEGCRPLAEFIGLTRFLELADTFGGEMIYIPNLTQLRVELRNRDIRAQYHGTPREIRHLSRKYRLSERQIRNIIHK